MCVPLCVTVCCKKSDLACEFLNVFGHVESFKFLIYVLHLSLGFLNVSVFI